jgi:hypothetical protein
MEMQTDVKKIQEFLKRSPDCSRNEIASATGLSRDTVQSILDVVVAAGEVVRIDTTDKALNYARYNLAGYLPPAAPAPVTDNRSEEQRWSDAARAKVLAEEAAKRPKPEPRHVITEAEIEAAKPALVRPLTPEEYEEASKRPVHRINPQKFIVR